jgi:hypothetical protein
MTAAELAERLAKRADCEAQHRTARVPHNGFGWTGSRCPQCGFMFFGQWEPWVESWQKATNADPGEPASLIGKS